MITFARALVIVMAFCRTADAFDATAPRPAPGPAFGSAFGSARALHRDGAATPNASASDVDCDGGPPAPASEGPKPRYILSLRQTDDECPTARACPGVAGMESVCRRIDTRFECDTFWSTGAIGALREGSVGAAMAVREEAVLACGNACASSISVASIVDRPLVPER